VNAKSPNGARVHVHARERTHRQANEVVARFALEGLAFGSRMEIAQAPRSCRALASRGGLFDLPSFCPLGQ
jgi:hypothetical protein